MIKILHIGNMKDIHTPKWIDYFDDQPGFECLRFHVERFSIGKLFELKLLVKSWEPDMVHAHYAGLPGLYGVLSGFRPLVVTIHGSEVLLSKGIKKWLVNQILKYADLVTTDSDRILKNLKQKNAWKINFGVEKEWFWDHNNKTNHPSVVYLRGDDDIYDFETFRNACMIVHRHLPNCTFHLYGNYHFLSETFDYNELLYESGFIKHGTVSQSKLSHELSDYWLYVSTALSDAGIASSTAEAMASELPCLVTDVAENHKWIPREELFKPGDYKDLATKMIGLLTFKPMRDIIGKRNRQTILDNNDYNIEMGKMEKIYLEVIENGKT